MVVRKSDPGQHLFIHSFIIDNPVFDYEPITSFLLSYIYSSGLSGSFQCTDFVTDWVLRVNHLVSQPTAKFPSVLPDLILASMIMSPTTGHYSFGLATMQRALALAARCSLFVRRNLK